MKMQVDSIKIKDKLCEYHQYIEKINVMLFKMEAT